MAKSKQIDPLEQLWRDLAKADGDGSAAEAHLAAGRAIYIAEDDTPPGLLIKKYPDGRRELVRFHREGDDEVIRDLPPDTTSPVQSSGSNTVSMAYDPSGRLFQTGGGNQGTTQFLYDGDALVAEYDGAGILRFPLVL